jgi:hypothetical protein
LLATYIRLLTACMGFLRCCIEFLRLVIGFLGFLYESVISDKKTKLKRNEVIATYDDLENFVFYHNRDHDLGGIEPFIIE